MRVVALLAAFNEERVIDACLRHLVGHGLEVYVIDNGSSDATAAIARRFLGRGVIGIEYFPRHGQYSWRPLLERKEQLASTLEADWFVHVDADEIRLPPASMRGTLAEALTEVDRLGFNAVNFLEFTFTPTAESPDHDHDDFLRTMRWYYPFAPSSQPTQVKAWKRRPDRVDLSSSAGHHVHFAGVRIYPEPFRMRHYLFLSPAHAVRKYVERRYDAVEVAAGWHAVRSRLHRDAIALPPASAMRVYVSDAQLDPSNPQTQHFLFASAARDPEVQA